MTELISTISVLAQITIAGAALIIAIISLLIARKVNRLDANEKVTSGFDSIVELALSNDKNLNSMDALFFPELKSEKIEAKRKRWCAYYILNSVERAYNAKKNKVLDSIHADPIVNNMLKNVFTNSEVKEAFEHGHYDPAFIKHAKLIISEIKQNNVVSDTINSNKINAK